MVVGAQTLDLLVGFGQIREDYNGVKVPLKIKCLMFFLVAQRTTNDESQ